MIRRFIQLAAFVGVPLSLMAACSRDAVIAEGPAPNVTAFGSADAGDQADGGTGDASLPEQTLMCPVTECPFPFATCPSSAFLCDANLLSDDNNCGACGVRCGGPNVGLSKWTCVDGKCTFSCDHPDMRDCDDNPTNGCETNVKLKAKGVADDCGFCGNKCPQGEICYKGECMTKCESEGQPDECPDPAKPGETYCTNLKKGKRKQDAYGVLDPDCAVCGNACDPSGPGLPPLPADMFYGCHNFKCNGQKCINGTRANCNFDLSDGCETQLATHDNCNACGDKCGPDQICYYDGFTPPHCICAPGETLCFGTTCVRVDDDPNHCGGCNHKCPGSNLPHYVPMCSSGICGGQCEAKFADCDRLAENGCEIDTRVDNRNCGGCGHACLLGQVCSGGECLVAPCSEGPTAK